MSHIFGCYGPFGSLKNPFFHGLIAQHFLTFIIEHPVFCKFGQKLIEPTSPTNEVDNSGASAQGLRVLVGELPMSWLVPGAETKTALARFSLLE